MLYLVLSIFCSTTNHLLFKAFGRYRINVLPAIVTNYLVCVLVGTLIMRPPVWDQVRLDAAWLPFAVVQGSLLIGSFFLMSVTTERNGVGIAALSARLSVIIPTAAAFFLYGDSAHPVKMAGIAIALVSLYLSVVERRGTVLSDQRVIHPFPVGLFLAFGVNLVLAKYVQAYHLEATAYAVYLTVSFLFAWLWGMAALVRTRARIGIRAKDLLAGGVLGVNNYGSLFFLLKTIGTPGWESSVVFPTISASVMAFSFLGGYLIFGEGITRRKLMALAIGVVAVVLINV